MTGALAGAIIVGAALGLLGSGGSILAVPILIYGLGTPEKTAIASSLAIVGCIASVGTVLQARRGALVPRCLIAFGLPGIGGAIVGGTLAGWAPAPLQLGVFALIALSAGVAMLQTSPNRSHDTMNGAISGSTHRVVAAGAGVGAVTGFVGVGGGFLLVPALQRFGQVELSAAVGTSLALITVNAVVGLTGQWIAGAAVALPMAVLAPFVVVGIAGLLLGQSGARRLPEASRRYVFATVLLLVSGYTWLRLGFA